ncbi:NucA/NucB deoxyribonuclease domain-containing protein [Rhodococcoides corynebacterioides]|uniref:NucA/NucB deoxyribonuclease domain-containing protein n=1 Tax=Rhodococcoides corynebacterioides TaxID=53972 RepID=UPI003AEAC6BA
MLEEQGLLDGGGAAQRVADPGTSLSREECRSLPQRQWGADRGYACMWREDYTFIYNRNSPTPTPGVQPVGRFHYIQEHELTAQWNNSAWTGKSAIHFYTGGVIGAATEALMSVSPVCSSSGAGCPVTGSGLSDVPVATNIDLETTFTVSNGTLATGAQVTNNATSKWVFTHPQTNPLRWNAPEARFPQVRCDRAASLTGQGCVIPAAEPIFDISSRGVQTHAQHTQRAQASGLPGVVNGVPLRRLVDPNAIQANRNSSCNRIPGPRAANTDCDEYPFASTYDGGASSGAVTRTYEDCNVAAGLSGGGSSIRVLDPDNIQNEGAGLSMCFINRQDNRSGGGYLSWFYRKQRLLDAETFYVN